MNIASTQLAAAQLGATQIGFLGNAILAGPGALTDTLAQLGDWAPADSVREAKPALAALLEALENQDEPVEDLRLSFTALQLLNGGLTRLDLSPIARRLSQIPADSYRAAADRAAESIAAAVRLPSHPVRDDSTPRLLRITGQMAEFHSFLRSVRRPDEISLMMRSLIHRLEEGRDFFTEVFAGRREEPSAEALGGYLLKWLITLNDLRDYGLKHYPGEMRKIIWEQIRVMERVIPLEILEGAFPQMRGSFPRAICRFLEDVLSHETGDFLGEPEYWSNVNRLAAFGLIPSAEELQGTGEVYAEKIRELPAAEQWPDGGGPYLREVLWPAFEAAFRHIYETTGGYFCRGGKKQGDRKTILGFFSAALHTFQKIRPFISEMHIDLPLMLAISEVYRSAPRAVSKDIFYQKFSSFIDRMSRHLAALPSEMFAKHREAIVRDFPEALHFREGLRFHSLTTAEAEAIQRWLTLRPEEKVVMHIGVRGDLEFVRQSVRQISKGGQVVLVDKDPSAFQPFLNDPEIREAYLDGLLKLETADYHGDGSWYFRNKYRRLADRVYLFHPVGDPAPVMEDIVAPGGLVFYQNTDKFFGRRYLLYDRPLFVEGDFERLAGYVNGPAFFKTETAKKLGDLGIRFSIARRKKEPSKMEPSKKEPPHVSNTTA